MPYILQKALQFLEGRDARKARESSPKPEFGATVILREFQRPKDLWHGLRASKLAGRSFASSGWRFALPEEAWKNDYAGGKSVTKDTVRGKMITSDRSSQLWIMSKPKQFSLHDFVEMTCRIHPPGRGTQWVMSLLGQRHVLEWRTDLDRQNARMLEIYHAMTPAQQNDPDAIDSTARREIAARAEVDVMEVSGFLRAFEMSRSMFQTVRPFSSQRGKDPTRVLGLVTDDPAHRDPSFLERPVPPRDLLIWAVFLLAIAAAFFLYPWLFPTLNR